MSLHDTRQDVEQSCGQLPLQLQRSVRVIDHALRLLPYFPCFDVTFAWYQDPEICKQVDNIDHV